MKRNLFYLFFLSAILGSCDDINYTGYVYGTVKAQSGDSTLANVVVQCGGKSYTTGSNGSYTINDVPVGTNTITAFKPKYNTYTNTVEVQSGGTKLDFFMQLTNPVK